MKRKEAMFQMRSIVARKKESAGSWLLTYTHISYSHRLCNGGIYIEGLQILAGSQASMDCLFKSLITR